MADLRSVSVHAEEAGFNSVWFPEHVVFFPEYESKYPYSADGDPGFGKRQGVYDPLFASTVVACSTERIRMGTAEIYRVVEEMPEVRDSLVVDLEYLGRSSFMPLFVVLQPDCVLDDALRERIRAQIRTKASARNTIALSSGNTAFR